MERKAPRNKKTINININESILNKLKDMGVSPTSIVADFFKLYANEISDDTEKLLKIAVIREQIQKLKVAISDLEEKKLLLDELEKLLKVSIEDFKMSVEETRLSKVMLKLDKMSIICNYDVAVIREKYQDLIDEIIVLSGDEKFDLKKRVEKVRVINQNR
jgi:hypothetical protein